MFFLVKRPVSFVINSIILLLVGFAIAVCAMYIHYYISADGRYSPFMLLIPFAFCLAFFDDMFSLSTFPFYTVITGYEFSDFGSNLMLGWWGAPLTLAIFIVLSSIVIFFLKGDAGKRIVRILIVSMKYSNYERASFWQILVRTAIKYVSITFPILFLFVFFNGERLFLHDFVAKTRVISRGEAIEAGIVKERKRSQTNR